MNESKKCVLVVDDDERILHFIKISLKLAGYDVILAQDGGAALKMIKSEKPDIMLLDILMSPVDGIEVMKQLRPEHTLPVIATSAHVSVAEEILGLGADDFLPKPYKPEEMVNKIRTVLSSR